jgi:hypothetical protein
VKVERSIVGRILAATYLLRRMMSELHSLRAATPSTILATAIDAHDLREQLHELFETVRVLAGKPQPRHADELKHKARGLIRGLASELEYLACLAERCQLEVPLGLDCSGMVN